MAGMNKLLDICASYDDTVPHFDVAMVIAEYYGKHLMYCDVDERWYLFQPNIHGWRTFTKYPAIVRKAMSEEIVSLFQERAKYWKAKADGVEDEQEGEAFASKAQRLRATCITLKNQGYKDSLFKELACIVSNPDIVKLIDEVPHVLRFNNGVYDFKERVFRDGRYDDYCSYSTKIDYKPFTADMKYLKEIQLYLSQVFPCEKMRLFVLQTLACMLDGSFRVEKFFVFTGSGSNSKSKLLELFQNVLGEYYCVFPIALLTQKRCASNAAQSELARAQGRRCAVMQEPGDNEVLNIGLMKELSGGDKIICRGLFKDAFEFKPQFKLIMTCNDKPEVPSNDGGTWRRIRIVPFNSKFVEKPKKKNEFLLDTSLNENLEMWKETFMSYLIQLYNEIPYTTKVNACGQEIRQLSVAEPNEVLKETKKYQIENDVVGSFIEESITWIDDDDRLVNTTLHSLYACYKMWLVQSGQKNKKSLTRPNFEKEFMLRMKDAYGEMNNADIYKRCKIKVPSEEEEEEETASSSTTSLQTKEAIVKRFGSWFRGAFEKDETNNYSCLANHVVDAFIQSELRGAEIDCGTKLGIQTALKCEIEQMGGVKKLAGKKRETTIFGLSCREDFRRIIEQLSA